MLGACSGDPSPETAPTAELTAGPLRWLMLPEEMQAARRLGGERETAAFLEGFWRRRNPDPGNASNDSNECARLFHQRAAAADRLYGDGATRGSMTDRGRALILLGPPTVLRYGQRQIPAFEPPPGRAATAPATRSRLVAVETWIYPLGELDPRLAALLAAAPATAGTDATLVFLTESARHTRLLEGERVLELAARALVLR